jgi:carbon monoxide dehydrogenase subunit G
VHVEQHVEIRRPAASVWAALEDVALIAECIPGAALAEQHGNDRFTGWLSVKVGPVATRFHVEVDVVRDSASLSGSVDGRGVDKMTSSQARARARYWLTALDVGATRLSVAADVTLSGVIGQFASASVVSQIASRLAEGFAGNISARLASEGATPPVVATGTPPLTVSLRVGDLCKAFVDRVKRALRLAA